MPVKLASELYGQQNKVIHQGFSVIGMPYTENKGFWVPVFRELSGRKNISGMGDMTLGERWEVISHLRRRGADVFNPRIPAKVRAWKKGDPNVFSGKVKRPLKVDKGRQALVEKVGAILADMKLPWGYADGIAQKRFDKPVVEYCKYKQLFKLVQMLAVYQKRHGKAGGPDAGSFAG